MPDITMCAGTKCPMKDTCYRFKAEPSPYRQSVFANPPLQENKCDHYWPTDDRDEVAEVRSLRKNSEG